MLDNLKDLKPELMWKHFDDICKIPHCSKDEERIRTHIKAFADKEGLDWEEDKVGSIFIRKPATPGYEDAPVVVLQGHMDMVCEKNSDVIHDFSKDPLKLEIKDGWLHAIGTTLGADNGIGVAIAMAILESEDLHHGPLEALFTVDEETGLTGAFALEPGFLRGRIMLNLDSEEDGTIYVGCAGGGDTKLHKEYPVQNAPAGWNSLDLVIKGLKGGHSGGDIHEQRGNAVKLLGRVLWDLASGSEIMISQLSGGDKHNAIPREAKASFFVNPDIIETVKKTVSKQERALKDEYDFREPNLSLSLEDGDLNSRGVIGKEDSVHMLALLNAMPHGVTKMSYEIPDLVETSNNLASANLKDGKLLMHTSTRSSIASSLEALRNNIESLGVLAGARIEKGEAYPGWKPNLSSKILETAKITHMDLFAREAEIKAIHAGLETGVIGEKYPGMDMISIGPQIENPHSPDEKVHIESCERFWKYVCEILARIK